MNNQTIKKSLSFEGKTLERAKQRAREKGFKHSFSAYVTKLIIDDLATPTRKPVKASV